MPINQSLIFVSSISFDEKGIWVLIVHWVGFFDTVVHLYKPDPIKV